ncbi:TraM recognition domain-containing protein [Chitinophaga varians]|uniref:TraM recognition domain-containing protein n=1 Tax=Chitinophaga varians TaxID=2202339 RepID=A0A847RQA7_9BACT|nr:conjugal transfer protein MobC [Chitinophaga varians]NLR67880.1 TraM recognition domain-containing protein [Chitinophaga varians]
MSSGENEQTLRSVIDFVRKSSIIVLCLHYYFFFYLAFEHWHLTWPIVKRVMLSLAETGIFKSVLVSKSISLLLLVVSLFGTPGKKDEKLKLPVIAICLIVGASLYFGSSMVMEVNLSSTIITIWYILITSVGYLFILSGGAKLSRLIKVKLGEDIFNEENETFPQQERLVENKYSINLPGLYNLKGKMRKMWINIINPFRATLVIGSGGSGKSYFIIRHVIKQHISKGFCVFLYDFKFDDLTKIAYNALLDNKHAYPVVPEFFYINFDDLNRTYRCNPLDPATMIDITDAAEASRTILLGLNKDWIKKSGDFFVESPINFVTAVIWFLKKYRNGIYCTLPHVVELMQADYTELFPVLSTEPEIEVLINPFITAFLNRAMEQLEGQVASAKIALARLSSPTLYYVLSGNEFSLDLNNPSSPKIISIGNNPLKIQIYGAVISLYTSRLIKLVNRKGMLPSSLIFDEYPTIYQPLDVLISTSRSNLCAVTVAVQSGEQLKQNYGREQADVLISLPGNLICGQTFGDTAKQVSERIGKIVQTRESVSINRNDTSVSKSTQLDYAVPASRIATLTSGEVCGLVADNPQEVIEKKRFHCFIQNDHKAIAEEEKNYKPLPVVRNITPLEVQNNYVTIKNDMIDLIETEIERIKNDPELAHLLFIGPDKK